MTQIDAKAFWQSKILEWETGRYAINPGPRPLLERLADRASDSLRFRLRAALALLAPHVHGKRVVELGCGSGLIAAELIRAGAAFYRGFDFADNAIDAARRRAAESGIADRAQFDVCAVSDLKALNADIVVSLGLFDWLNDEELATVFSASGTADYLHAIAERQANVAQWIHRCYVLLAYGYRTDTYVPRYFAVDEIAALATQCGASAPKAYRDRRLSFGALLTTLPLPEGPIL